MRTLLDNGFVTLLYDEQHDLLYACRHPRSFSDLSEVTKLFSTLFAAALPYQGKPLILDFRKARGNNDPQLEQTIRPMMVRLGDVFPLQAVLVQTATGRLQMQRLSREHGRGTPMNVFSDEAEALAFLDAQRKK